MLQKCCSTCGKNFEITNFHRNKNTKDGRTGRCKFCVAEYHRGFRKSTIPNPDRTRGEQLKNRPIYNPETRWPVECNKCSGRIVIRADVQNNVFHFHCVMNEGHDWTKEIFAYGVNW